MSEQIPVATRYGFSEPPDGGPAVLTMYDRDGQALAAFPAGPHVLVDLASVLLLAARKRFGRFVHVAPLGARDR